MPQPSEHEIEVFNMALDLSARERAAYLDRACAGDTALRWRVEELLQASEKSCPCLEGSAAFPSGPGGTVRLPPVPAEKPGDRIGRYKLLQQIGEGGCGVVYEAEQEEPVRRRVALKVIKSGMDTKQVIARFEAERQALALMDHPNIAKVLEAGATDTGRPYFAMELVRGTKVTDYCDRHHLTTLERLGLFIQVCRAIQHAHQKGIIHRDIKPSNILVTMDDRAPLPKVIDFGIAKATSGQRLTDKTLFTAFEQLIGTPAYMSPEQAEMNTVDIDTRSDIYALGVLLYELLTGRTPFDPKDLLAAGLDEMRRTIREKEPPRPSTRLSTMLAVELVTVAKTRQTEPLKLIHQTRGDLDWIVMKAMEKDRARRYETANGLAMDITRHLNCEPVLARPPSRFYEFQKTVRRHRVGFAASAALITVLMSATGISAWQAVRANRAETLAERRLVESEANATLAQQRLADSEAISKFLTEVFQSPDPRRNGRTMTVAETLGTAAKKLDTELEDQPARRSKLQATLASTYELLGLYQEAIPLQEKVRDYYASAYGLENTNSLNAMHDLAWLYSSIDRWDEAIKMQEQVLTLRRKLLGPEHSDTLKAMHQLAISYYSAGRQHEALKLREKVLALRLKVSGPDDDDALWAMFDLSSSYRNAGRWEEALKLREQVLVRRRKLNGPQHPSTILAMELVAESDSDFRDRLGDALKLQEEVIELMRKVYGPEHPYTLIAFDIMARIYDNAGHFDEALQAREEAFAGRLKVLGPAHPDTIATMNDLADSYMTIGRSMDAMALLKKISELQPKDTGASLHLAILQRWFGQDADYEASRRRLVKEAEGTDQARTAERAAMASILKPSDDHDLLSKALSLAQRSVELGQGDPALPWYHLAVGLAEHRNGQYAAAARTLTLAEQTAGADRDLPGIARLFRAMSLIRQNKPEEARKLFRQVEAQMPPLPKDGSKPLVDGKPVSHDQLVCWLAYKEAKALLEGP